MAKKTQKKKAAAPAKGTASQRSATPRKKKTAAKRGTASKAKPAGKSSKAPGSGSSAVERLEGQLDAVWAISEVMADAVGFDGLLERVVPLISQSLDAERCTLFLVEQTTGGLWSRVAEGEKRTTIRLEAGQGLAGWVAEKQKALRVDHAYSDKRFNPEVDARTGYRTLTVMAVPVRNRKRERLGVIQVLNKRGGKFSDDDLRLLEAIATQTAYAIENAQLAEELLEQNRQLETSRRRSEHRRAELDLLYQLEQESSAYDKLDQMLDSMIVRVCERMQSRGGSILLSEQETGRLFFRGVSGPEAEKLKEVILEPGEGIVGWVAERGEPVIVNTPEDDPRYDGKVADQIQVPAQAILAVPLVWDRRIIGAVEVLNPIPDGDGDNNEQGLYTLEDLKVLTVIAGQVARAVSLAQERQAKVQTERLALMGRMLAGVAHDLRTPMTVISGYAQLMAVDPLDDSRQDRCDRILRQVDEMTAMVGDLLSFARGDSKLRTRQVHVGQLGAEIAENLREHCDARQIAFALDAGDGIAYIDAGRAKRIVYNLAKNAMDVMGAGDTLTVGLEPRERGLSVRVADTGPGIPEEIKTRLFEPFVTSGKEDGTGLGLSIVRRFVEDHHGKIEVESVAGVGTTFEIFLSAAADRMREPETLGGIR
ncbi:MAG: GAF domain-containing protein [Myxococcota bacterium]